MQGSIEKGVEIFTDLKDGNLDDLIEDDKMTKTRLNNVLYHVLQALDFLANQNLIHRDVKPENIFYIDRDGNCRFQLGDFGLCNSVVTARTFVGSLMFMAPEVTADSSMLQTPKIDVWSLFVTMAYTMDVAGYRTKSLQTRAQFIDTAQAAAGMDQLKPLASMAIIDPGKRASAAQMLVRIYGGQGLSTPRK